MPLFFAGITSPVALLGILGVLVFRLGAIGLVGIAVVVLLIPLQFIIGWKNGQLLQKVNHHKDARMKICSEIIDGIKFIKLYAW